MQGDSVRITAQLIDARTDQHLWSKTYDRRMDDIFQVQEEIATAITSVLRDLLGARTVQVARPTADLEAWELFLRARPLYFRRGNDLFTARELLQEAVARDPRFAQAWALLAATHYVMPSYFGDIDTEAAATAAREAAERALALDPRQPVAWAVQAMLATDAGHRDEGAAHMQKALEADPNDATAWLWSGIAEAQAGRLKEARSRFSRAIALDPLVGINHSWLGTVQLMLGDIEPGKATLARARELGTAGDPLWALIQLASAAGPGPALAQKVREYLPQDAARPSRQQPMWNAVADALADPAQLPQARAAIAASITAHPGDRHSDALLLLGLHHEALIEELRVPGGYGDFLSRVWFPHDRPLREDPLYLELATARGLLAYWQQRGFPDQCRLVEAPPAHLECAR
jgi:Tfp pilus assembly protein PilF